MKRHLSTVGVALLAVLVPATAARADWLLTPFLGLSFEGSVPDRATAFGGSLTFMGRGALGFEIDGAFTPDLLNSGDALDLTVGDTNVGTLIANLVIGAPRGGTGIRPYVSAGAGLMRVNVDSPVDVLDISDDGFGVSVGAGLWGFVTERVALRADLRYFRRLEDVDDDGVELDLGTFRFWRGTVGLTLRF